MASEKVLRVHRTCGKGVPSFRFSLAAAFERPPDPGEGGDLIVSTAWSYIM